MKAVIIHHTDADGYISALVAKTALLERNADIELLFVPFDYKTPFNKELLQTDYLYLLDASYSPEVLTEIKKVLGDRFIWIDHHETAIKQSRTSNEIFSGVQSTETAACLLTWRYFYGQFSKAPLVVTQIALYDTWQHTSDWDTVTYPINLFVNTFWSDVASLNPAQLRDDNAILEAATIGQALYAFEQIDGERAARASRLDIIKIAGKELKVLSCNSTQHNSQFLAEYAVSNNIECDVFMNYHYGPNSWKISLYLPEGVDGVHCGELCKSISSNGGGHKAAAGCNVSDTEFRKLFSTLFDN
jgi:oligoribonuclease NrnB/cAMP/cGMP phosphodiesterase (DHH superfamily)